MTMACRERMSQQHRPRLVMIKAYPEPGCSGVRSYCSPLSRVQNFRIAT